MTNSSSEWVSRHFSGCMEKLTPRQLQAAAQVFYLPRSFDPEVYQHCASVLSRAELDRAERFLKEDDRPVAELSLDRS